MVISMQNNSDEPAFSAPQNGPDGQTQYGMSLRDWFAGKALLAGILADPENDCDFFLRDGRRNDGSWGAVPAKTIAISCYAMADAMMEARKWQGNEE